ncbi:MAG TPA: molybdopterin-dependent oxidoreductase [Acidimicrobiia bacterium]|nr:molybdopterin-dependent oxidoreductase [Acidimicrobiia bacterium]
MGTHLTVTHFGAYEVESDGESVTAVHPFAKDPDPSPIGQSLEAIGRNRVMRPAIRRSWLEDGPGARPELRGQEPFVEVPWDTALDLVAADIERVRTDHGNAALFGGSYGWGSAGRFHHAQSQIYRFMHSIGGHTNKVGTYSTAAASVIVPHVVGEEWRSLQARYTSWPVIARHTDLIVAFGGLPLKNSQAQHGGQGRHALRGWLERAADRGTRFVNVSPVRDDLVASLGAEWLAARPGSDVAIMLGLVHTLVDEGLADEDFLATYCVGWERLREYVVGESDGVAKSAEWAAGLSEVPAERIRYLANEMAGGRTLVTASWSLQRAEHGEQPYWMAVALAASLGQIGLPGGGFGLGYGAIGSIGNGVKRLSLPALPVPPNPIDSFIPVARIADMLLEPGASFDFDGGRYTYPDIRLVYWAGGNPFHHHQDLNRLSRAWQKPETIVIHDPFWTPASKRADVVLPATTALERVDIGGAPTDDFIFAMPAVIRPVGAARDDYAIFADLAERLGAGSAFTEGRDAGAWVRHMYDEFRADHPEYPTYQEFCDLGFVQHVESYPGEAELVLFEEFRADPNGHPLGTPSGRIELFSEAIDGFGYPDCVGHPAWFEPSEWLGRPGPFPLHLTSNQPSTRLHSQLDHGVTSRQAKVAGREPIRIHPADAAARGIASGDVVRVFNDRGACLAGAVVSDDVRAGVVQLSTGAWYDPVAPDGTCAHGNPNVLTRDVGTSSLAQGPSAHTCMVDVEIAVDPPPVRAFELPDLVRI